MFKQVRSTLQLWKEKNNVADEVELIAYEDRIEGKYIYFRIGSVEYLYETISGGDLSVKHLGKYRHIGNIKQVRPEYQQNKILSLINMLAQI